MNVKIKLNYDLAGYKAGDAFFVECDKNNIPLDIYWRKRLKDSSIDKCVELVLNDSEKSNDLHEQKNVNPSKKNKGEK